MAPPPPASMPLQQRLLALAQTLQFAWFSGHVTLLLCALRYGLSYITFHPNSGWARYSYRTAFVAAAVTYGIVVYKSVRARARQGQANNKQPASYLSLAADENVQYLIMALIWLVSVQVPLALAPFSVYSVFHVATYTRSNLLPTIQPQQQGKQASGLSEAIGKFVREYYDSSMLLVALLEIALWFRIFGSALLFQRGSWILLVVYTVFARARHSQSTFMQNAFTQTSARIDSYVGNQNTPPAVRNCWEQAKGTIRQIADATDLNKLVRQQQGAPKKAQ